MYVCICQAVTDKQIRCAAARGACSVEDLRDDLGVSSACGCCAQLAESILQETRRSRPVVLDNLATASAG